MSKGIPEKLSEDQIKYWMANTNLTREELLEWYASFFQDSEKIERIDKAHFTKLINRLNVKTHHTDSLNEYMFRGEICFF
jgi:Ca2+-binding EF-hand superfamily protein